MKLDVSCMRYLTKDDYRVLVAVEMGMRNHELVSVDLITSIARLRHGGIYKILSTLLRHKLVAHANQQYNGYRLSYLGYDILALRTLLAQGVITSVGSQIGVGKESDIFEAMDEDGNEIVVKIHRLGRTSFRAVRRQRDYMAGKSKASWLYMSRLAAIKEYAFMQALFAHEFPTPTPIAQNRHVVAMSRVKGFPLAQLKAGAVPEPVAARVFAYCMAMLRRLAEHGLIHCDFNEFNLMIDDEGLKVTLIDFPQMISTDHPNAGELFARDVNCLIKFFAMKMRYIPPAELSLRLEDIEVTMGAVGEGALSASGLSGEEEEQLAAYLRSGGAQEGEGEEEEGETAGVVEDAAQDQEQEQEQQEEEEEDLEDILTGDLGDLGDLDSEGEGAAGEGGLSPQKVRKVRERARRGMHGGGRKGSRNMTKKRNKYGKIDYKQKDLY